MRKIKNHWVHKEGYDCFGCSPDNPLGVKMEFYEDGDDIVCFWKPQAHYQGWIDTLHGGIQATLIDECASWVVFRKLQTSGVTNRLEVKYRYGRTLHRGRGRLFHHESGESARDGLHPL